ncbi:MAG: type I-E CRISPR-associated protein Cse2/CasB [Oscillibacter sp.]|nr:type I-E CRISPR-associated protein Cse2/CasB [Oscillibacter sp.]
MNVDRKQVFDYVSNKIDRITQIDPKAKVPDRAARATLARLRRGVGKMPGAVPEMWGDFLQDMPEEFYNQYSPGSPSYAQWAVYIAQTLFAIHQQGWDIQTERAHQENGKSLGTAALELVMSEEMNEGGHKMSDEEIEKSRERIWRRFYKVAVADDMMELAYYLRGMVQLFKSNGISLDYIRLAGDLFDFQFQDRRDRVRLRWGEDFYRIRKGEIDDENESVS